MSKVAEPLSLPRLPASLAVPGVKAFTTLRGQGRSVGPYAGLNVGAHVGDKPSSVAANRQYLYSALPDKTKPVWLEQVHGTRVVAAHAPASLIADGAWTDRTGVACAVMTADCLPVVFAAADASCVAVAHAGWRGLAAGILASTVNALPVPAQRLHVWLGPAIGPAAFEVGVEVQAAFIDALGASAAACFRPVEGGDKWLCDLYALARLSLLQLGCARVTGGEYCTLTEDNDFYSYRRDGITGRMATLVYLQPN